MKMTEENFRELLKNFTPEEKDTLYRILWEDYVRADVEGISIDRELNLTDKQIENVVHKYIYSGDADSTISYWDNLEYLIEDELLDK